VDGTGLELKGLGRATIDMLLSGQVGECIFWSGPQTESPRITSKIGGAPMRHISNWWRGRFVENEPNAKLIFMNSINMHWTARSAHSAVDYLKEHHR
jgi:hypothetical protein